MDSCYTYTQGDIAQLGERCVRNAEAASSNLVISRGGSIAQPG